MELGLKDKRVLVTGSSRGIGLAIATAFLREGARVVLTGRTDKALDDAASSLRKAFSADRVLSVRCDVSRSDDISMLKEKLKRSWHGIDTIVANVGSGISVPDAIPPADHFTTVFDINFTTSVDTVRTFLPLLRESHGNILFISSIAGMEAFGAPVDYSVAKTAVLAFSKNISRKLAIERIRVNCIAPGNIRFPGGSWDNKFNNDPERIANLIASSVPMNRFGTPEEIADAAVFLCSERASFITGAVLCVDGGQTVTLF